MQTHDDDDVKRNKIDCVIRTNLLTKIGEQTEEKFISY